MCRRPSPASACSFSPHRSPPHKLPPLGRDAARRGGTPQPPPTNLQILPKDIPRPQLIQTMQSISAALGVQCNYCHVQEGRGGRNDMASDEKATKKAARNMLVLTREINEKVPDAVSKAADGTTRVGCATCHRGVANPKLLPDVITEAAATGGPAAGIAKYKELRAKYYGGQSYDFSENGLLTIAQRATAANKPDDALAYLQANLEYYPKSARTLSGDGAGEERRRATRPARSRISKKRWSSTRTTRRRKRSSRISRSKNL